MGSSSERTSTSYFSVSDGIRIYEEEIARNNLRSSLSVDSLLLDETPGQTRLERSVSPPPPPSRRASREQKKVTYADLKSRRGESSDHDMILCRAEERNEDSVNDNEEEEDWYSSSIPRLPSVKDLAAIFQPRLSPEAKPRKSVMKVWSSVGQPVLGLMEN